MGASSRGFFFSALVFLSINLLLAIAGYFVEGIQTPQSWLTLLWGVAAILAVGFYLDATLLKISEVQIPYLWLAVWPLAFPGNFSVGLSLKVLLGGSMVLILFILITRSYGKSPSPISFFLWGLLSGMSVWSRISPLIIVPLVLGMGAVVHPLNLRQVVVLLLGSASVTLWAWLLVDNIMLLPDKSEGLFNGLESWDNGVLFAVWTVLWITGLVGGNLWLLSRLQSLKVWHRRIISASWVGLVMLPWTVLWGFELTEAVWLTLPFSGLSLVAFYNWAPNRQGIWLFLLVNAALLIISFASR